MICSYAKGDYAFTAANARAGQADANRARNTGTEVST